MISFVLLQKNGEQPSKLVVLPCHRNERSHEIALRLRELIALSPSLRANSLSVLWTLTCRVTGKNQGKNPWTRQRKEEVSSSIREPIVWMARVLPVEEKPAGHLKFPPPTQRALMSSSCPFKRQLRAALPA